MSEQFEEEDIEEPPMVCESCDLSFVIVASRDYYMQQGMRFDNYCPRCGELMEGREPW